MRLNRTRRAQNRPETSRYSVHLLNGWTERSKGQEGGLLPDILSKSGNDHAFELNRLQFMNSGVMRSLSECYGVNAEWLAVK